MADELTTEHPAAVELTGITQTFGSIRALVDVDFRVERGEIVALLGENGSGKSTLVKVLAGVNVPDPGGALRVAGDEVALPLRPGQFRGLGMSFVHQELGLARTLTVLENLLVADTASGAISATVIDWRKQRARIQQVLDSYGVAIDPLAVVNRLPPVGQALVAIVRAAEEIKAYRRSGADGGHAVIFLDEPTVFLPENEVEFLFDLIRTIVRDGVSAVFISHDLSAVRKLCDRAVVLRDGRAVGEASMATVSDQELIELIVGPVAAGKLVGQSHRRNDAAAEAAPPVCRLRDLHGGLTRGVELDIHPGEIVGLAGLLGSGAEDVPALCFGARRATAGTLELHGRTWPLTSMDPARAVRERIALVPADRRRDAVAPTLTAAENVSSLVTDRYTRFGAIQGRRLAARVGELMEKFDIRPRRPSSEMSKFSGGNAQKTVLAKWFEIDPRLLLLHEPTQGVDVAARAEIYRHVRDAADGGMATLWVSSDFDELATVCDRVLIVAGGVVRQELAGDEVSESAISSAVYHHSTATLPEVPA